MKLYHTGKEEIRIPDVRHGRKNADFGQGFYLTPDKEFALRWAGRDAVINEYELDTEGLAVHRFTRSREWFDYIFRNRRMQDPLKADVVIGPIANDTIYDTFGIIGSGLLDPDDALSLLLIGPEYIQAALKSEKAAAQLTWTGAEAMRDPERYRQILRKEQEAYRKLFAEAMLKLDR